MSDLSRRRRLVRWLTWTLAAVLAGTAAWYGYRVAAGQTTAPVYTRASAENARAALRAAGGARWAPELTRTAERALREAQLEHRRQEAAFFLVRNYDGARDRLRRAEEQLRQAARVAVERQRELRGQAESAIAKADIAVKRTENIARAMALSKYEHMLLQKSRMAVHEAQLLLAADEYDGAVKQADLAALQAGRVTGRAAEAAARFTDPQQVRRWRRMIDDTVAWSRRTGGKALIVIKESHTMTLFDDGRPVKSWKVELGSNSVRDKLHAGDNATPEGEYQVTEKKNVGQSRYHRALLLNYPNTEDRAHFDRMRRAGHVPRGVSPGGLIEIHGEGGRGKDWTNGCVAVTNREMDDLFGRVGVGTLVTIVGSDGNGGTFTNMVRMHTADSGAAAVN